MDKEVPGITEFTDLVLGEPEKNPIVEEDDDDFFSMMQPRWATIHCVARCMDCDFYTDDFRTAWDEANDHCDATGHQVTVEKGIVTTKDYHREEKQKGVVGK